MFMEEDGVFNTCATSGLFLVAFVAQAMQHFLEDSANVTFRGTRQPRLLTNNNSTTTFKFQIISLLNVRIWK
jgi:hypothetical protein